MMIVLLVVFAIAVELLLSSLGTLVVWNDFIVRHLHTATHCTFGAALELQLVLTAIVMVAALMRGAFSDV